MPRRWGSVVRGCSLFSPGCGVGSPGSSAWVSSVAAIEGRCRGAGFLRSWPHVPGGGRRGCGAGGVPVWVVAGGPCGPDSPGASPLPKRPACPRPRSATFAHDDRPVLFVRASSPVALAVVRATMAPPSGMGGSVGGMPRSSGLCAGGPGTHLVGRFVGREGQQLRSTITT